MMTVTTAGMPSGIAATARLTATMNVSISEATCSIGHARHSPSRKMNAQMPSTAAERMRLSCARRSCRGVRSSLASCRAVSILPISVRMPVEVTTASARP